MSKKVILHLSGEDPILAEMAAMPATTDQFITVRNPRKRDGKPLNYLTDGATFVSLSALARHLHRGDGRRRGGGREQQPGRLLP